MQHNVRWFSLTDRQTRKVTVTEKKEKLVIVQSRRLLLIKGSEYTGVGGNEYCCGTKAELSPSVLPIKKTNIFQVTSCFDNKDVCKLSYLTHQPASDSSITSQRFYFNRRP